MTVSVNGAELFYSTRGNGPACLVLSGIGTKPYERMTPPQLSDRFRLVYVDLRGSGQSTGEPTDLTFDVLHCPGHTPGHLVFVCKPEGFAVVGDTLFAGSIGRTDMPNGSQSQLISAIKAKLLPLGDDVTILPGHGPASTIGEERASNPFLRG